MPGARSPTTSHGTGASPAAAGVSAHASALERAGLWSKISFSWVGPLIRSGWSRELSEEDARFLVPSCDDATALAEKFDTAFAVTKAKHSTSANLTTRTLFKLYWRDLIYHSFWVAIEVACRLLAPVALRGFLTYMQKSAADPSLPEWPGWLWAIFVAAAGGCITIIHHQFFWVGMRMGFTMRQQVIAAIHAKVLRLNSASIVHASTGHIVNMASNDVRRFDDALPFWLFTWAAPLETIMVLLMVSLELGFVPAICGVGACLSVMPLQAVLVRTVGGLRMNTAVRTDERVRLTGEVIQGALAMKMLGWEEPFAKAICAIRGQEVHYAGRMAQIRGLNLALQFCMTPVASFTTFAVYYALNKSLSLPSIFYVLSLLHLPKLYMVYFFVLAVQYLTELRVSLQRIDKFLSMAEPPPPVHHRAAAAAAAGAGAQDESDLPVGTVALRGADYDWNSNVQIDVPHSSDPHKHQKGKGEHLKEVKTTSDGIAAAGGVQGAAGVGTGTSSSSSREGSEEAAMDGTPTGGPTLKGIRLQVEPGELLGVAGEVGSGKSSLLAALLGELQPLRGAEGSSPGEGPLMAGSVAYCSQVPWIMADTVKGNILFGQAYDAGYYDAVIESCALRQDLEELPAGEDTELGERGINLSGGQKARVALARAAYSRANIHLLDDPLSAVDPRVGRTLFDKCIGPGGLMQGSTRVLVTHQRQYLPRCDRVAVLRGGRLVALGTWQELQEQQLPELGAGESSMHLDTDTEEEEQQPQQQEQQQVRSAPDGGIAVSLPVANGATGLLDLPAGNGTLTGGQLATTAIAAVGGAPQRSPRSVTFNIEQQPNNQLPLAAAAAAAATPSSSLSSAAAAVSGDDEAGSSDVAADIKAWEVKKGQHLELQRDRTMAPDLNRRPANAGWSDVPFGLTRRGSILSRSFASLRIGSVFTRNKSIGRRMGAQEAVDPGLPASTSAASVGQLVRAEKRAVGGVTWKVYGQYCVQVGLLVCILLSLALLAGQAVFLAAEWWLALWSSSPVEQQGQQKWLSVYGGLTGLLVVVSIIRASSFFVFTLGAATKMHNTMVKRVLRAPLSFFHTNPAGRVLNRFSSDQGRVDDQLPMALFDVLQTGFMCLGAFVLVSTAVPFILPVFLPLVLLFYYLRQRYVTTSRQVKRLDATTRSPVYASFSATLKGLPTIRAYSAQSRFHQVFLGNLSLNGTWWVAFISTARWIGFRLDLIATTTLVAGVLLAMAVRARVSAAVLALALTHVLQLTGMLQWWVRQTAEVENTMTSVERLLEYTELEQEPPRVSEGGPKPPPCWPTSGSLTYSKVTASYRPGLPAVLKDLSFHLPGGCSCGVVGRTGSGKSSLMLTLFRLIDINDGTIFLDGVDTSSVALDALRSQLAIIPQDPVLFSGTLRSNLDPWGLHPDAALWEVLGRVQLKGAIAAAGGLTARMAECGDNLSVGQRQLFCLARALLQEAKVLALDEATANVDRATDALIQKALRDFAHGNADAGRVLLVIAHRIDTIMDCDQLLVLSNGVLVESGSPAHLTSTSGGVFAGMVAAAKAAAARGAVMES